MDPRPSNSDYEEQSRLCQGHILQTVSILLLQGGVPLNSSYYELCTVLLLPEFLPLLSLLICPINRLSGIGFRTFLEKQIYLIKGTVHLICWYLCPLKRFLVYSRQIAGWRVHRFGLCKGWDFGFRLLGGSGLFWVAFAFQLKVYAVAGWV